MKCLLCERETDEPQVFDLSPVERKLAGRDQLTYCQPCYGILKDPSTASSVMISLIEVKLRKLGVAVTPETLDKYRAKLDGLLRRYQKLS